MTKEEQMQGRRVESVSGEKVQTKRAARRAKDAVEPDEHPLADDHPYSHLEHCDIVMEGGITSGVVYPGALGELSQAFRLHNIGGTSAGAIAAAGAAAAELS